MTEIFRTRVTGVGPLATSFLSEGLFVTFGGSAPEALLEFCFIIDLGKSESGLRPGQVFSVDGRPFPITAVGEVAQKNLDALGHITVKLDGSDEPQMAGAIHVRCDGPAPEIIVGSVLTIEEP